MLPAGSFVLGGAASGKSLWAENLLISSGLSPVYVATGRIGDAETRARVEIHRARRDQRWTTLEEALHLTGPLASLTTGQAVLIDCATMWLSNHFLEDNDIQHAQGMMLRALDLCAAPWVIVSNEVGQGIVPDNALSRRFREAQGRLNIALAARADLAVQIVAGLPNVLKGQLP